MQMKIGKMIWCGAIVLALLCFSSVPKVHAQAFDNITLAAKLKIVASIRGGSVLLETKKLGEKVVLRFEAFGGANTCGGYEYDIVVLQEPDAGDQCIDEVVGIVNTCDGEQTAIGFFILTGDADNFPGPGLEAFCRFIAEVTSTGIKSTGAYCEIEDAVTFDDLGYSSKVSLKGKAKDPQKLLDCTP